MVHHFVEGVHFFLAAFRQLPVELGRPLENKAGRPLGSGIRVQRRNQIDDVLPGLDFRRARRTSPRRSSRHDVPVHL